MGSPDGSRHPLDCYEFAEEDYQQLENGNENGQHHSTRSNIGIWECLISCRHRLDQQLARRRVSKVTEFFPVQNQIFCPLVK